MSSEEQFPVFLQQYYNDCGPTCLYMISEYYKLGIEYSVIKSYCDFTGNGVTLQSMMDTALKIGLNPLSIKIETAILKEIPLPAILLWNNNHFVVLYKIIENNFYIANPLYGLADFPEERFLLSLGNSTNMGYVLLLELTPENK